MTEGKFISRRTHSRCASARATVDVRRPLKDGLIPGPRRRAVADGRMDACHCRQADSPSRCCRRIRRRVANGRKSEHGKAPLCAPLPTDDAEHGKASLRTLQETDSPSRCCRRIRRRVANRRKSEHGKASLCAPLPTDDAEHGKVSPVCSVADGRMDAQRE